MLWFAATDAHVVEEFARNDPYVIHGLVRAWKVRPWTTVIGAQAHAPVHPQGD